jgi:hypothetical protein
MHIYSTSTWAKQFRVVDPDSETLWIRIRIRIGNPDPDPDPGARKLKKFQWKNALISYFKKNVTTEKV